MRDQRRGSDNPPSTSMMAQMKEGFAFATLVIVLLLRPQGLFGDATSRAVAA